MKIELRNIQHISKMSEETACFTATLYIDGAKAGRVSNRGHGGCNEYDDNTAEDRLNEYAKTLPPKEFKSYGTRTHQKIKLDMNADLIVGDLLDEWLLERDFVKAMKAKLLYTKTGEPVVYEIRVRPEQMTAAMNDHAWLRMQIPQADKILNIMPKVEALALYRAATQ